MPTWAIVPVKPFQQSKGRLSSVLSTGEREALSRDMLAHTLDVLAHVPSVAHTLVISRDPAALALAREHRARTVTESGAPELNAALVRAMRFARAFGAGAVLILPADLPLLSREDVESLLAHGSRLKRSASLAPDRRGDGTNAFFMRPPGLVKPAFGPGSFQRHLKRLRQAKADVHVLSLSGFELDLDLPEDLELYRSLVRGRPHLSGAESSGHLPLVAEMDSPQTA